MAGQLPGHARLRLRDRIWIDLMDSDDEIVDFGDNEENNALQQNIDNGQAQQHVQSAQKQAPRWHATPSPPPPGHSQPLRPRKLDP